MEQHAVGRGSVELGYGDGIGCIAALGAVYRAAVDVGPGVVGETVDGERLLHAVLLVGKYKFRLVAWLVEAHYRCAYGIRAEVDERLHIEANEGKHQGISH